MQKNMLRVILDTNILISFIIKDLLSLHSINQTLILTISQFELVA